jgi:hypothetical protein
MYHLRFSYDEVMYGHFILPVWNDTSWGWQLSTAEMLRSNGLVTVKWCNYLVLQIKNYVEKCQQLYCSQHPPNISTHWHLTQTPKHLTITKSLTVHALFHSRFEILILQQHTSFKSVCCVYCTELPEQTHVHLSELQAY